MTTLLTIIVAVIGFGILVFFHEGGHFIVAKLFGVKVETFAIGWGPKLIGFTKGGTSYQISVFPIGGFCKFKGDEAIDESDESVRDPDSFYGTASWKRLLIAFAGPFMNFLIAVIMFSCLAMCSTDRQRLDSRILLIDDVQSKFGEVTEHSPASEGGLLSGDKIVAINGKPIHYYDELTKTMIYNGKKPIVFTVERDGQTVNITVNPRWDASQMKAVIGVYYWLSPTVADAADNKLAKYMNLADGDIIVSIDGDTENITDIYINQFLQRHFGENKTAIFGINRGDTYFETPVVFDEINHIISLDDCWLNFAVPTVHTPGKLPHAALWDGLCQSGDVIAMSAIGLYSLIFMPKKNVQNQVGGPIRIGAMIGEATISGFKSNFADGVRNFAYIISVISLALAFFNLLPFPAVDGGHIVLCLYEMIVRRKLKLKVLYIINLAGFAVLILVSIVIAYIDVSNLIK